MLARANYILMPNFREGIKTFINEVQLLSIFKDKDFMEARFGWHWSGFAFFDLFALLFNKNLRKIEKRII